MGKTFNSEEEFNIDLAKQLIDSGAIELPKDGIDGEDGAKGETGKSGLDGKDGKDGKSGARGSDGRDGTDGESIKGEKGKDGIDGIDADVDGIVEEVLKKVPKTKSNARGGGIAGLNRVAEEGVNKWTGTGILNFGSSFNISPTNNGVDIFLANDTITITDPEFTPDTSYRTILVDASNGDVTINLLPAEDNDRVEYHIKKIDASTNAVIVDPDDTEKIDDALTAEITTPYESITIVCDGTGWTIH